MRERLARTRVSVQVMLGVLMLAGLSACEEDITAVTGTEFAFSLFGVISPQLDTQWVRVFPIEQRLVPTEREPIDAQVTSTDLTTGEQFQWRDSTILDFANQYAHVFWAPFRAEFGHTYRIEAERSDGAISTVEITVPLQSSVELLEPEVSSGRVILPVLIPGDVPRVLRVEVDYSVAYHPITLPDNVSATITVPYFSGPHRVEEGWRIPIDLTNDFDRVRGFILEELDETIDFAVGVILLNVTVRLIVGNADWNPPNNRFDVALLVQPGVMRNVQNGFGFVGAGYRLQRLWTPPLDAIEQSGFVPPDVDF